MSKDKPKPNYYLILPDGTATTTYVKNLEAAKSLLLSLDNKVKLLKIKRG